MTSETEDFPSQYIYDMHSYLHSHTSSGKFVNKANVLQSYESYINGQRSFSTHLLDSVTDMAVVFKTFLNFILDLAYMDLELVK